MTVGDGEGVAVGTVALGVAVPVVGDGVAVGVAVGWLVAVGVGSAATGYTGLSAQFSALSRILKRMCVDPVRPPLTAAVWVMPLVAETTAVIQG